MSSMGLDFFLEPMPSRKLGLGVVFLLGSLLYFGLEVPSSSSNVVLPQFILIEFFRSNFLEFFRSILFGFILKG